VNCPHCHTPLSAQIEVCGGCGFHARALAVCLGDQWVKLDRITDAANCLRLEDVRGCEEALDDLERQFPQVFLAIYTGVLPSGLSPAEVGFWLLNQGAFTTTHLMKRNDYGAAVVLDPATRCLSISLGYGLEQILGSDASMRLLKAAVPMLRRQAFGEAMQRIIAELARKLRREARCLQWTPDAAASEPAAQMQPLRSGHRPALRPHESSFTSQPTRSKTAS
jgi:hypothetical protein